MIFIFLLAMHGFAKKKKLTRVFFYQSILLSNTKQLATEHTVK